MDRVIEACFSEGAKAALLYAANLTPTFFDLSSGDAGAILQKLRNYSAEVAELPHSACGGLPHGEAVFSSRFGEMVADEQRGTHFGIFETRQAARDWLGQDHRDAM